MIIKNRHVILLVNFALILVDHWQFFPWFAMHFYSKIICNAFLNTKMITNEFILIALLSSVKLVLIPDYWFSMDNKLSAETG